MRTKLLGFKLRVSLIVAPLVMAMLALALAPVASLLRLHAALVDVRWEIGFLLHLCRIEIQGVGQSGIYFDIAFRGEDASGLDAPAAETRAAFAALKRWNLAPRQAERLERVERTYVRLSEAGEEAAELARRGEREASRKLVLDALAGQRDAELLRLVDAAQIEGSLALRKSLDELLAAAARIAPVPPLGSLEDDAGSLRQAASQVISLAGFALQAQRLLGEYRAFAYLGETREELAIAEREFDHAYMLWEAQVGDGGDAAAPEGMPDLGGEVRAIRQAVRELAEPDREESRAELVRLYESQLKPLGSESLPRALTAALNVHQREISKLVDSIAMRSLLGGTTLGAVTALALGLALVCPWLISKWIVRPVLDLTRAARELSVGRPSPPVAVCSGGEIGELADTFNRMAERLAERGRELEAERARERLGHAERLAAVGTLASGLAHQINNPINNILLTARDALGDDGPEAAGHWREALDACADEAMRCGRIVRGLVAFSRGEPGQKWREDAHDVLRRAYDLTAGAAAEHRATVEIHSCQEPVPILANSIALEQALVNVIRNAIQSRPGAHVDLRTERLEGTVRIEIRDDGVGLDRTALGRLFDPFYTTRAEQGGIGLGLSVTHRIVADHGGDIRVDSPGPGEGTTVTVDLPLDLEGGGSR